MKYIKLKAYKDGSVGILQNDLQFYIDNDGAELWVDFSSADVSGLRKWVDFVMADGSETSRPILAEFTTEDKLVIVLDNTITKAGPLKLQPYANNPSTGQRVNFEIIRVVVGPSLNVLSDSSFVDETALEAALAGKMNIDGLNSNLDELHFGTTPTSTDTLLAGQLRWNTIDGTIELGMNGGGVIQSIGLENYYRITNRTGSQIDDGVLVMFNGSIGGSGRLKAKKWDTTSPEFYIMGIATENIPNGDDGFITWHGPVNGIQTNGVNYGETWVDGDILYPSTTIQGGLTKVANSFAPVAAVVRARASNGQLYVRCK